MENDKKKNRKSIGHLSIAQKTKLIDIMSSKPTLRSGKFSKDFSFKDGQREWEQIANILNAIPGSQKNWRLWRKTWQDLQAKAKSKKAEFKKAINKTGGGPPPEPINELDEGIVALINNNSVVGHDGVQESLVQDIIIDETIMEIPLLLSPPPEFQVNQEHEGQVNQEQEGQVNQEQEGQVNPEQAQVNQENQQGANVKGNKNSTNKKINMKSLLKDKLELKKKFVESTITFQAEYIRLQEERNRILQEILKKYFEGKERKDNQ